MQSLVITVGVAGVVSAVATGALRAPLSNFRSREIKRGAHQIAAPTGVSGKLPLVAGPGVWLGVSAALLIAAARGREAGWWIALAVAGAFCFGLADDVRKFMRGRGIPEGPYLASAVVLAIGGTALLIGPGAHAAGSHSPFALAHWLGQSQHLPLSAWYFALILGTMLASSFSDGLDGLTAGTVGIAAAGVAVAAGLSGGAAGALWPATVAAGAAGALAWNLPSRWSPANRGARRAAQAYLGDSGALALGMGAACSAIVAGADLLWPIIAGPLLLEGFSSLVQAKVLVPLYRRIRDPRLPDGRPLPHQRFPLPLLAAPLHYHWERLGMDRLTVVLMFWVVSLATAVASAAAAGLPWRAAAAAALGVGAFIVAALWLSAMWLRPAFLMREHDLLVVAHGRPWRLGRIRLFKRRGVAANSAAADAAESRGLLGRVSNAHALDEVVASLVESARGAGAKVPR